MDNTSEESLNKYQITMIVTSCNRYELLEKTVESFFKYNTYPIHKIIIIDDSGKQGCIDDIINHIPKNINCVVLYNNDNIGQIMSIDKVYELVDTPYVFHCEDDWEFYESGFIEHSLDILNIDQEILNVWLRGYDNYKIVDNGHPVLLEIYEGKWRRLEPKFLGKFMGFTFNPTVKRMIDYAKLAPYSKYIKKDDRYGGNVEIYLNELYEKLGYYSVVTLNEKGYVKHIGFDNPTKR